MPITYARVVAESRSLAQLFWDRTRPIRVVTTVPFEHIYGYQFGFFWPRFACLDAPETCAVLPCDVKAELARSSGPSWLVTTAAHISALAEAGLRADNVRHVFSAPNLTPQHAEEVRRCFGVWPIEIYGGAETGTIGWREYDGRDRVWQCIPGKHLVRRLDGTIELRCADFAASEPIADSLDLVSPQRFRIVAHAERSTDSGRVAVAMGALDAA